MRHLFHEWKILRERLTEKRLLLCLDYDGTLAPISRTPEQALLPIKTRKAIEGLVSLPQCTVAIISGRSANDLKYMVKVKKAIYIGNHGYEIKSDELSFHVPQSKELRYAIWNTYKKLVNKLANVNGVLLENKKYTLSVHYRLVKGTAVERVQNMVSEILNTPSIHPHLKFSFGKMVIDIKPRSDWDKGVAANFLATELLSLPEKEYIPLCIGDDLTDEDLFYAFKLKGVNVRIGNTQNTCADYYLDDVLQTQTLLEELVSSFKSVNNLRTI